MWEKKEIPFIVFIDKEDKLEIKPTYLMDNEHTTFPDRHFHTIFYDPPHTWGGGVHFFSFPNREARQKVFPHSSGVPTYYGWDKYKTKTELLAHIYRAQREFYRILTDDGLLWFKWNEMSIKVDRVLACFPLWQELMRLYVNDPTHTAGFQQTFWILMCKQKGEFEQKTLLDSPLLEQVSELELNAT